MITLSAHLYQDGPIKHLHMLGSLANVEVFGAFSRFWLQ